MEFVANWLGSWFQIFLVSLHFALFPVTIWRRRKLSLSINLNMKACIDVHSFLKEITQLLACFMIRWFKHSSSKTYLKQCIKAKYLPGLASFSPEEGVGLKARVRYPFDSGSSRDACWCRSSIDGNSLTSLQRLQGNLINLDIFYECSLVNSEI